MRASKFVRVGIAAAIGLSAAIPTNAQDVTSYYRHLRTGPIGDASPPAESPSLDFSASSLPTEGMIGLPLNAAGWTLSGGTAPLFVSLSGAPLGVIAGSHLSGTPQQAGVFNYTLTATDSGSPSKTKSIPGTITIYPAFEAIPSAEPQDTAMEGLPIAPVTLVASGGKPPYRFDIDGSLPSGVAMNQQTGVLSGAPTQSGNFSFRLTAADSFRPTVSLATQQFSLLVNPVTALNLNVSPPLPAEAIRGTGIAQVAIMPNGGRMPYSYSASGLPAGLRITGNVLEGVPTETGTFAISVTATDSRQPVAQTQTRNQTLVVYEPFVTAMSGAMQPDGQVGVAITPVTWSGTGGKLPYTYSTTGTLPPGLSFDNGELHGTPTQTGSFTFSMRVANAFNPMDVRVLGPHTMNVAPEAVPEMTLSANPALPTEAMVGVPVTNSVTTIGGGMGPFTVAPAGSLPAGLQFAGDMLFGIPTQAGPFNLTITATDSSPEPQVKSISSSLIVYDEFTASIPADPVTVATMGLPIPTVAVNSAGGKGPYNYTVMGTLPSGVTFENGVLQGTPDSYGSFDFTLVVSENFARRSASFGPYRMTIE